MCKIHWVIEKEKDENWYLEHGTTQVSKAEASSAEWELRRAGYSVTGVTDC